MPPVCTMALITVMYTPIVDTDGKAIGDMPVHIYLEFHSVCPLVGIRPPRPFSRSECVPSPGTKGGGGTPVPSPGTKGGGGTLACWRGVGEFQSGRLEKILALCLLCAVQAQNLLTRSQSQLWTPIGWRGLM